MLTTIILFVLILGLLIFVHELGHFFVSRRLGVKVEEFGMGFPPRIFGFYRNGDKKWKFIKGGKEIEENMPTVYSLNWLPIGGFCKIKGEDGEGGQDKDSFANKPVWRRALILVAGVSMNVLLAMLFLIVGFKIGLPTAIEGDMTGVEVRDRAVQVMAVSEDSPADLAGIKIGDKITVVAGETIEEVERASDITSANKGKEIEIEIERGEESHKFSVKPREEYAEGDGPVGVSLVETGIVSYPWHKAIWRGFVSTFTLLAAIVIALAGVVKGLFMGAGVADQISGPVGIAVLTGQMAQLGYVYIIQFVALLSLNLAIINLFPLPALDGGRLIFLAIEKIRGKQVSRKLENTIHMVGFVILILLMLAITFRDVFKFKDIFINLGKRIIGL